MPGTHKIRIRGPWGYSLPDGTTGVVKLPAPLNDACESARFSRFFNWLAELDPDERVVLVFTAYGGTGSVWLNGAVLGDLSGDRAEFEVGTRLLPRNEIETQLDFSELAPEAPRGLWGDVCLEVRSGPDHHSGD